jgi:hypothetical protein
LLFLRGSGCARLTAGRQARLCDVDVTAKRLQRAKAELKRLEAEAAEAAG